MLEKQINPRQNPVLRLILQGLVINTWGTICPKNRDLYFHRPDRILPGILAHSDQYFGKLGIFGPGKLMADITFESSLSKSDVDACHD